MSAELTALGLAALWQVAQITFAAISLRQDTGFDWNVGPRDTQPEMSIRTARLKRAVDNHFEGLIFFTIAVVMVSLADRGGVVTAVLAWTYLLARVLYVPAYAYGWTPWRSVIWAFGFLATLGMIIKALL